MKDTDYSQTAFTYFSNGNLKDQSAYTGFATATGDPTTGNTQTTTTAYDTAGYNTYPISVTNELEQVTQTGYDYTLGLPNSVTDANNVQTLAAYDNFGRMTKIAAPGDSLTTPTLAITYFNYNSATNKPFQINLVQRVSDTAAIQLSRFYDGAGRQIQTQTVGAVVNGTPKNVVVDYQYDAVGRLVKQSIPWPRTNVTPVFEAQDFSQHTLTVYDILGRTLSVTQPNANQVQYTYTDLTTTVTDPKLNATTTTMDVWGRTLRVDPPAGPAVGYVYDVKGQLLKAIRSTSTEVGNCLANPMTNCPNSKTVSIQYDSAGRKLNMNDPDMGYWEYEYDALGNLKVQTDNRECMLSLGYDFLNRLTTKTSSGTGCVNQISTSYFYDNDNPGTPLVYDPPTSGNTQVGRRTHMIDISGSTTWSYDARGRIISELKTIDTQSFTTQWTEYNSADLPVELVYPDNEELTYSYNSDGTLNAVTSNTGGTYLASTKYDEAGRIKSMDYGASIIQKVFTYFPFNTAIQGGLLNTAVTTRQSDYALLQSFEYTYDKNANVLTIKDYLAGPQTQTFSYDALNRLTSAVADGTIGQYDESYEYDANTGNLSVKDGVTYTYHTSHPHAVESLTNGNSYDYDANGNMTLRNVDALTYDLAYDAENRLVNVAAQGGEGLSAFGQTLEMVGTSDSEVESAVSTETPIAVETMPASPNPITPTITPTAIPSATTTPSPTPTMVLPTVDFSIQTATPTPTETTLSLAGSEGEMEAQGGALEGSGEITTFSSVAYYVNIATGNNSNACTSPAAPCRNIQETINKAASGDTIYVATGTYVFSTNGTPNVVILNGKNLTLSGGWDSSFTSQTGASTINGANVNNGILVISGTVVVENFIIENSTSSNSGAIYIVNGNLTVQRSTLRNNVATNNGAGIFVDNGVVNIINSTISGNQANNGGGGVYAANNSGASVTIQNSTITYNQASQGGGISRTNGSYTISNTLIGNNTATTSNPDCSGTIASVNYSLIENMTGCTITSGSNNLNVDPQIASTLSGTMLVHQPLAGSPVINAGTTTGCPAVDQQGITRPQGSSCEIGAVEVFVAAPQLGLQVTASPTFYAVAGEVIQYTYTLTNTGNIPLTSPYTVTDNKVPSVNCSAAVSPLAVGNSTTCTGSYTVTQTDVTNGVIANSASATADYNTQTITSNAAGATVTVPKLRLQIEANPDNFTQAGQIIQYTYTLTNIGSVTLSGPYSVTDNTVASVNCSAASSPLASGNSTTCTGSYTVTQTDVTNGTITNTASATASDGLHTITSNNASATITLPTATQVFSNAVFTYDGDGKRVKSEMDMSISTVITYFVGTHYEVTDGVVTKYYYAGSQRIAMRKDGVLSYLLGDHLGSTSLVTDASGQNPIETRYTAWGEVRYASDNLPTNYSYTGQYSNASDFGLMYYNARWYDPALSRFAQADSIIPDAGNIQAWDRYLYTGNNPIRYTDPDGHCWFCIPVSIGVVTAVTAWVGWDIFTNTPPIRKTDAPLPERRNLTSWVVDRINKDTKAPITQALKNNLSSTKATENLGALKAWVGLVGEGGAWDYKVEINKSGLTQANANIKLGDITTNYQAVANMTYGILAAEIGLPQSVAEAGAGFAQIMNNYHPGDSSGIGGLDTFGDDPFDNYWINFGYEFQQNHHNEFGSLTPDVLTTAINEYISKNGEPGKPLKPGN